MNDFYGHGVGSLYDYFAAPSRAAELERLGQGNYFNFGYWSSETTNPRQASDNLMAKLVHYLQPQNDQALNQHVLDVACGLGATTRYLAKSWAPANITAVNFTPAQIAYCRQQMPIVNFLVMDATALTLPDETFDHVICVEAAFHFDTRADFLREAFRVLKKGGRLAMTDLLHVQDAKPMFASPRAKLENYLPSESAYRDLLLAIGFREAQAEDVSAQSMLPFHKYIQAQQPAERNAVQVRAAQLQFLRMNREIFFKNVLCFAIK